MASWVIQDFLFTSEKPSEDHSYIGSVTGDSKQNIHGIKQQTQRLQRATTHPELCLESRHEDSEETVLDLLSKINESRKQNGVQSRVHKCP